MERQFQCPSCGAGNVVTNPGILMKVCDYCKTAIYWDKESALRAGNKSMDLPPSTRFRLAASGKIKGRSFRVLGRLRYAHANGEWDEWFLEMSDGKIMWLSEDEGELFLETPLTLTEPVPPHNELQAGQKIKLDEKVGIVEEIGEAKCLGGEGQIPFAVEIGEVYPYADGAGEDGSFSFGLEYDTGGNTPTAYIGTILSLKDAKTRPEEREAPLARTALAIRCDSCGKPYEGPRVETTKMVVCGSCGAGLALDEAETKVLGKNPEKLSKFSFGVGTPIKLEGVAYEVMGRLHYVEVDEGAEYSSYEFVLYNKDEGYLWLSEEKGHFTISRPLHTRVPVPPIPVPKMTVQVGPKTFKVFESGTVSLRWVDGALPWIAKVGEKTTYVHLIAPPEYLDQEITGKEVELFRGRYVDHEEMRAAVPEGVRVPDPVGVSSCQPYKASDWVRGTALIAGIFLLLNILLLIYAVKADKSTPLLTQNLAAADYSKECMTKPFEVKTNGNILRLEGSARTSNSWVSLDFGVVDAEDRVTCETYGEISYYHGSDSEGAWSEGSNSFSTHFKVDKAGTYRLLVYGTGGSETAGPARNEPVHLFLTGDNVLPWCFLIPIIIAGLLLIPEPLAAHGFEKKRWADVLPDSDDSGDDD